MTTLHGAFTFESELDADAAEAHLQELLEGLQVRLRFSVEVVD